MKEEAKFYRSDNCVICVIHSKFFGRNFKGVAKCAPNDNFDEEFGKELARNRALLKLTKAKMASHATTCKYMHQCAEDFERVSKEQFNYWVKDTQKVARYSENIKLLLAKYQKVEE